MEMSKDFWYGVIAGMWGQWILYSLVLVIVGMIKDRKKINDQ